MSNTVSIPSYLAEGRRAPFPKGTFIGDVGEVKASWSDDNRNLRFSIDVRNITPVEGPNVGARPYRFSLQVIYDGQSIVDVQTFDDNVPFALQRTAGSVAQLALALAAAQVSQDGNVTLDMESFLNDLENGVYKGQAIMFEVAHRAWTSKKTGKSGVDDSPVRFGAPAVNGNGAAEEQAEQEELPLPTAADAQQILTAAAAQASTSKRTLRTRQ